MPDPDMSLMNRLGEKGRLAAGGGGSDDGGMLETRVATLEGDMREIKGILARIEKRLDAIDTKLDKFDERLRRVETEIAELKGRVSQLPSTWVMVTFGVSMTLTLAGFVLALFRLGLPVGN